ncbi:MAG: DNA methyltransferase [Candidatus Sumerlaeia bacterium]|nr:DNA methyltransferase [Candidatus Sumerlaeia bacterium]
MAQPAPLLSDGNQVFQGDNLPLLSAWPGETFHLIYIDPPFNTGTVQKRSVLKTTAVTEEAEGDRRGFGGRLYKTERGEAMGYEDSFEDFMGFLRPRLQQAHRLLKQNGAFFLHLDYREVHYAKVECDKIFGRECFVNEIIWSYDYGARSTKRWSAKHDNILWYVKNPGEYTFNFEAMDRIPYMAPGLVGPEKAARGKTPTDVWWHTIVPTNGSERTGYTTQKPLGILERIVKIHSNPGDRILDFFAGSGTTGHAALLNNRCFTLIDQNPEAITVMRNRFAPWGTEVEFVVSPVE